MAAISGYGGSVTAGSVVGNLADWTIDMKRDNFDVSAFQQNGGFKDNLNGLGEWSGQISGNYDIQDPGQAALQTAWLTGATIALSLDTGSATGTSTTTSGGGTYGGTANITDITVKTPVNNKVDITIKYKGKGILTFA